MKTAMTMTTAAPFDGSVRELDAFELDAVGGGALLGVLSLGVDIESQSAFQSQTLWRDGLIAEKLDSYQSVSGGAFSFGINL